MKKNNMSWLDKEESERVSEVIKSCGEGINLKDIFKYDKVKNAINDDYLIIQGSFNKGFNIISSLPLYSNIFAEICPSCISNADILTIKPLLDTGCVFPILINQYSSYPKVFIEEIIKYPHVTMFEFRNIRNLILSNKLDKYACIHCIKEKFSKIKITGLNKTEENLLRSMIDMVIDKVSPFLSFDDEILLNLEASLKDKNIENVLKLAKMSYGIDSIRIAEAFGSPLLVGEDTIIDDLPDKYIPLHLNRLLQFPEDIILKGLELEVPIDSNIAKYIDILMNNRNDLKKIVKRIITQSSKKHNIDNSEISNLLNVIANFNDKVRRLQKSKKYRLLKIGTEILGANKGLLSTLICAIVLGFQGNIVGCGASMSAGMLTKMLSGNDKLNDILKKFQLQGPTEELKELILNSLEPSLQRLLSVLLWTDLRVIQTMRIKEKIEHLK